MTNFIKSFLFILIIVFIMPLGIVSYTEVTQYLGLKKLPVQVLGTGSMYPSLFWDQSEGGPDNSAKSVVNEYRTTPMMYRRFQGFNFRGKTYLRRQIGLGDMVTFKSQATQNILKKEHRDTSAGFIKRVVALPGDTVEFRDGYLYRNHQQVSEPYIYKPRSTYGQEFLSDCQSLTIPANFYMVLGDNRKISSDSRGELGLIHDQDISFVLPYAEQTIYHSLWRDTSHDADLAGTPSLNAKEFYDLVNQVRLKASLPKLRPNKLLEKSASYKASEILAGNPDYTLTASLNKAGYKNSVTGELSIKGRFTAQELLENILYFSDTKAQLLDKRFTQIGVDDLNKAVNSCPTEVVVVHLGGYVPAKYETDTINSWQNLIDNLEISISSWQSALDNSDLNRDKVKQLLVILYRRLDLAKNILTTMQNKQWLSDTQIDKIDRDKLDADQAQSLADQLNQ